MLPPFQVRKILPPKTDAQVQGGPDTFSSVGSTLKEDKSHQRSISRGKSLLPFQNYSDGIVRMKTEEYEDLVKIQPKAALRYLDEDDGEIILVR